MKLRPQKGDLVQMVLTPAARKFFKNAGITFVATVLQCRHKTNAYYILPANSPLTTEPYWVSGDLIEVLRDS